MHRASQPFTRTIVNILMLIFTSLAWSSCTNSEQVREDKKVEARVTAEGVAQRAKTGPLVTLDNGSIVWVDLEEWPDDVLGKKVFVSGVMTTRSDLPVFVHKKGAPIRSGMPVPEGTDLKKASQRQVLTKIEWKLVERPGR